MTAAESAAVLRLRCQADGSHFSVADHIAQADTDDSIAITTNFPVLPYPYR